jgi:FkbM family methyltransferase
VRRLIGDAVLATLPGALVRGSRASRSARTLEPAAVALSRLFGDRPTAVRTGPARGLLLRPEPRSVAWLTGKVEPEVQHTVVGLLRPGDTFVDVGASVGFFALLAARVIGPDGAVVAFEPSTAQADSLRTNVALNDFTNVDVAEMALSDRAGIAFLDAPGTATATLVAAAGPGAAAVETITLDAYRRQRPHVAPAVVKVDVEGHEEAVLAGMRETLRTVRPALVVELHDSRGFVDLLTDAGYTVGDLGGARRFAKAPPTHVLAVPASRPSGQRPVEP